MTKNKFFLAPQALVLTLVLASGCSALKDMDNMNNKTSDLDGKTAQVEHTSEDLDGKTTQILDLTGMVQGNAADTFYALRQGNAVDLRAKMLNQMDKAKTVEAKVAFATVYFEAFEFALWTGKAKDTQDYLEGQYLQAIQEFDREVTQYIPRDFKVDPTSKSNQMSNLYALAITMHMQNELEINQPALPNDDVTHTKPYRVSMFDLVKSSLVATNAINQGKIESNTITPWQAEGGSAALPLFTYLMQTRENFLPVMALAKVSNVNDDEGFFGKVGFGWAVDFVRAGWKEVSQWDSKIPSLNILQSQQIKTWYDESIADRDFNKSVGIDASLDSNILKIYAKMNKPGAALTQQNPSAGEEKAAKDRTGAGDALWMDIQNLIKG